MAQRKRTTLYSGAGKKLYAVRAADGTFKDIQSYARAHRADLAHASAAEAAAAAGKDARMQAAKAAPKKIPAARKTATRAGGPDRCKESRRKSRTAASHGGKAGENRREKTGAAGRATLKEFRSNLRRRAQRPASHPGRSRTPPHIIQRTP